jgi:4-alpha-glucanotransferase
MIRAAYGSVADRAVVPLQDVFGLGSEARMNTPGVAEGNWTWRASLQDFRPDRAARLHRLAQLTGRLS